MNDEDRDEILIRLDQWREQTSQQYLIDKEIINKRLDSHAGDIKSLREWRFYYGGIFAAIGAYLGMGRIH